MDHLTTYELKIQFPKPPIIWCDNQSTALLLANPIQHVRTKHTELDLYFVRKKSSSMEDSCQTCAFVDQVTEDFTKPSQAQGFSFYVTNSEFNNCLQGV